MNRILIDELGKKEKDDTYKVLINKDNNLLINSNYNNYEINIYNSKVNIFGIIEDISNLNIKLNLYSSDVTFNLVTNKVKNCLIQSNLYENKSRLTMYNTIYANEKVKLKTLTFHRGNNTQSYIYNCGVTMKDGSIDFDIISKVTKEYCNCILKQDSKIISLNNTNNNKINPILLIDNYDTEASHSAFIGKFNENEVFYLQSKGIKKSDVYRLLLDGFLIGVMEISLEEKEQLKEKFNKDWR